MPTQPDKHRQWCKSCQDWTIHSRELMETKSKCSCGKEFEPYYLNEIPEHKLQEQRARRREYNRRQFGMINAYMSMLALGGNSGYGGGDIVEADAGQKEIDAEANRKREAERKRRKDMVEEYRGLGRNEPCKCGSGLKYKKCHYQEIQSYK